MERIIGLYKKAMFSYIGDYEVLMVEVGNVGYDAIGKGIEGSELNEVVNRINSFIKSN